MLVAIRDGIDANSNDKVSKTSMIHVPVKGDVKDAINDYNAASIDYLCQAKGVLAPSPSMTTVQ